MFTGIITATAKIKSHTTKNGSLFLTVATPKKYKLKPGDSIATDGTCLTVKKVSQGSYLTELMSETLTKTKFGKLIPATVNLEQSLVVGGVLNGHFVTGHVDAVGKVEKIKKSGMSKIFQISFPKKFRKLVATKGSITIDGVSLTVVDVSATHFSVSLVDYTLEHTTLGKLQTGDTVNLEFDILAKYLHTQ